MQKKYFIWEIFGDDKASRNAWVITELDLIVPSDPNELLKGKPIPHWDKENRALYPKSGEGFRTDSVFADRVFLHSGRLRRLIESLAPGEVEYHPILIERRDEKKQVKGYSAMVVLDPVDGIDWSKTPHEVVDGEKQVQDEEQMVLDRERIGGRKIFYLRGNNNTVIVRADVVDALLNARVSGLGFSEVRAEGESPDQGEASLPAATVTAAPAAVRESREERPAADSLFEARVEDILACLGETKPKSYSKKITDIKRLDPETMGRALIEAVERGDWSRVALPMLVGGQVTDLFITSRIPIEIWDRGLEALERASEKAKLAPGPGFLRIYQELGRGLLSMAETHIDRDGFLRRVQAFRESRGWQWTRANFGPKPGFDRYELMEDFDQKIEGWLSEGAAPAVASSPVKAAEPAPAAPAPPAVAAAVAEPAPRAARGRKPKEAAKASTAAPAATTTLFDGVKPEAPVAPETLPALDTIPISLKRKHEEDQTVSKFGGLPFVPAAEGWPHCGQCGQPLIFLFQMKDSDTPLLKFPAGMDLFVLFGCVNENCPNRTGETADTSLWRFYKSTAKGPLVDAAPEGVEVLTPCAMTFKEPQPDYYDPGMSATMNKRERKKAFGEFGENYRSVKAGGYASFWREPQWPQTDDGRPMELFLQLTPEGIRTNLTSSFVNQAEYFADRLELWWYDPTWNQGPRSLVRVVQKA